MAYGGSNNEYERRVPLPEIENLYQGLAIGSSKRKQKRMHSRQPTYKEDGYVMVAAIDFGTTYSGYAFSFTSNPEQIFMNKNWGALAGCELYQTPTSVLMKSNGSFEAFGHEAETKYCELVDDPNGFEMYKHFKMVLHKEKNISRNSIVKSARGKECRAMTIFVMALKYLRDHLLEAITKSKLAEPSNDMIRWVLTVPAIWTDGAKQFMREAAMEAGLIDNKDSRQLLIALEPEVASLFCRRTDIGDFITKGDLTELPFKQNTKYLVIDAGGGTVDITAHEIVSEDGVRELYVADGGPWGGIGVDKEFVNTLKYLLGEKLIDSFIKKHPSQWMPIMNSFERAKKLVDPNNNATRINIQISWALGKHCQEITGEDVETILKKHPDKGISFQNGSIVFNHNASIALFKKVIDKTKQHISQLLRNDQLQDIAYVVLVGGFGESKVLQQGLKEVLPRHISMLVPPEAQLAVIKGAVHFGLYRKEVKSRIARKTYGLAAMHKFDPKKHDPKRKRIGQGGSEWCDDVYEVFVCKGDSVETGHVITKQKTAVFEGQNQMDIDIYCTDKSDFDRVEYVSSMEKMGEINVKMPREKKVVKLQFLFGETEIQVKGTDVATGNTAHTNMEFLRE